ncbi:HAD-IA family hydrolase [Streptomyces sp. NPDC048483]|uniref:HAD-IA family hydrolase n=1 Tax=Streptomyces sp. NPDC048483 TaxID=3154927 RepID=UPI003432307A
MPKPPPPAREPSFDAVLCDLDGVIRFYDMTEVTRLEEAAGLPPGSTAAIGYAPENDLPLLLGQITRSQWAQSIVRGLAPRVPLPHARALARAFSRADFRADAQVVDLLRRARRRCPLVLVTNAPPWLDNDLASLGLADLADGVINSSRVGIAKPDRRIYEIAAHRAGARTDRCLFVDDRPENIEAAVALGMTGVHFRGAGDLRTALAPLLG